MASTLVEFQSLLGHDSTLLTYSPGGLRLYPLNSPLLTAAAAIDQYAVKKISSEAMFSLMRRQHSSRQRLEPRSDSIIHLHWVEGLISHAQIAHWASSGRNVVWSLHDMAPFTGGCHSSLSCLAYERGCSNCPQVRSVFKKMVSKNLAQSDQAGLKDSSIRLVAPSKWLASKAERSQVFSNHSVSVIENPVAIDFFQSMSRAASRQKLGLESDDFVAIVIAAQLESPLKQVDKFLAMFEKVSRHSKMRRRVLLVGSGGSRFAAQYSNTIWLGELAPEAVAETIAAADFVASSSLSESAGLTVREAGAVGVPALVLRNGGSDELVKDGESGYLFQTLEDMSLRIESLLADPSPLIGLGKSANQLARGHAHPEMVAKKFLELYRLGN